MNNWINFIGYIGSFLSAITFFPQVYKSWKAKSVGDLSIWMILIVISSTIVWLIYGFNIPQGGPVIAANIVVLSLALVLFYFKLTFPKK